MGFQRSKNEPIVYMQVSKNLDILLLCLYVDDIIFMGSSMAMVNKFRESMMNTFDMTDLGLLQYFLGLEVTQKNGTIFVSQRKYVEDLDKKFGMSNCKHMTTPLNINEKLQNNDSSGLANEKKYRSDDGGILCLTHTRLDLMFAVGPKFKITSYIDSDWGVSIDDWRSTTSWVFNLGSRAIAWALKKQEITALSSTEAEYIAATTNEQVADILTKVLSAAKHEYF
ncbi:uncharacterized mitochondrial protein AtMg00810-like [Dioscorea cayenensis subsp. rotundata]|uniref:Uncharacterized mitochondrial protein AtMg00810-like n=1 Tax=Dioscorea cayennensis subsp. rotundata TaxID=55577 RepID=A0AB40CAH4_DIOCR|nr:uncharacterized mitochondrial protein AtMg00810-like [Dioscorea cayenensis subsp. rotundata]